MASIVYVIKGAKENIIVHSGISDPEWAEKYQIIEGACENSGNV